MSSVSHRPSAASEKKGHAYLAACTRAENQIAQLATAKGIAVAVEIDPGRALHHIPAAIDELAGFGNIAGGGEKANGPEGPAPKP